jgi:hypothetical protein
LKDKRLENLLVIAFNPSHANVGNGNWKFKKKKINNKKLKFDINEMKFNLRYFKIIFFFFSDKNK